MHDRYCVGLRPELDNYVKKGKAYVRYFKGYAIAHVKDASKISEDFTLKTMERATLLTQVIKDS